MPPEQWPVSGDEGGKVATSGGVRKINQWVQLNYIKRSLLLINGNYSEI
jgi:hypothetical protein